MNLVYEYNHLRSTWEYETKKTLLKSTPYITHIEPTNNCNYKCSFCAEGLGKIKREKSFMSKEVFEKIISENRENLHHVCLYYHGESLLHPDLIYFIKRLKEVGCSVGLTTNGMLLTREMSKLIMEAGVDTLSVSFQGTDEETFNNEQIGGNYETVNDNIIDAVLNKNIHNFKTRIYVSILDTPGTHDKLNQFTETWRTQDVTVVVAQVEPWFGWVKPTKREQGLTCVNPWKTAAVTWNGDVYPSSCDYEGPPFGNLTETPLKNIWNNLRFVELRENLLHYPERLSFPCSVCNQGGTPPEGVSGFLIGEADYFLSRLSKKLLPQKKVLYLTLNRCGR